MPIQWRNQIWQSLEEGAGKRCSESGPVCPVVAEFGGRFRKAMLGVCHSCGVSVAVSLCCLWLEPSRFASGLLVGWLVFFSVAAAVQSARQMNVAVFYSSPLLL